MGLSPVELINHAKRMVSQAFPQLLINKQHCGALPHLRATLSSRMPTQLEGAMDALITVFYNYSGNDGDKHKLNKGELKELLHSELTDFLTSSSRTATPTGGIKASVKEIDKVCVMAIGESGALTPSDIFSSSVPALARQDRKPQSQKDPMLVEKIMNDLDSNKDNEVDFNEFVVLVAALTVACNDFFQAQNKK
ncbi:Protein S100-Z [Takifugu flavidus]|uniref:Protein S100-Z n=1 Tax=Takifugu flavidus TaxID=433684 RepID=A0A5C6NKV3_9TELE|nr:Protein S100-Z [Takifugu flavidus]